MLLLKQGLNQEEGRIGTRRPVFLARGRKSPNDDSDSRIQDDVDATGLEDSQLLLERAGGSRGDTPVDGRERVSDGNKHA